ncbi:hypothetical protein Sjap_000985 [Stephania japonica]|uniref:Phosphoinositide phospholipase C n=1 Tax=Stephania japonica TaxID=461633 RepID=A0AAP0PSX2_9MAGN
MDGVTVAEKSARNTQRSALQLMRVHRDRKYLLNALWLRTVAPLNHLHSRIEGNLKILDRSNSICTYRLIIDLINRSAMANYKVGMFFTRKFKITEPEPPQDVKEAFGRFTATAMSPDQLLRFLIDFQRDPDAKIADAEHIVNHIMQKRHQIAKFTRHSLSLDDFHHFLFSEDLNAPIESKVCQDMTAPLSHYFIYTGHNSYLTGNQLSSDCSDVPIRKALERGVRVIELDIWPNSSKDDVDVLHGRSIKEHAFSASPYPVIVTLEDHLTPDLQEKVAEMVTQTFGDMLFYPEEDCLEEFPSPESLKHRIILSTKPPKEYLEGKNARDKQKEQAEEDKWGKDILDPEDEPEPDDKNDSDESEHNPDDQDEDDSDSRARHLVAPEYKRLIGIHAKKHKGDLTESLKVDTNRVGRLSLSEPTLKKAAISNGTDLVRYLWVMHGMFRANGGCGYVKKPDLLMKENSDNEVFNPKANLSVKKTLKVTIYMGDGWRSDFSPTHFDNYSPPDFYARVGIAGVPADVVMKKTSAIEDNWIPVWNEAFLFPLTVPELALLRIEVHEYDMSEKDDFGGQTCLPVWQIRPGIRAVPLFDRNGDKFNSVKLLMRFEFV